MIDKAKFYDSVRKEFGNLSQKQVNGFEAILNEGIKREIDNRFLAYMLATVWHETAKTMQPIEEFGKGKGKRYGKKIKASGATYTTPDKIYYGRGFVQLTWFENYEKASKKIGVDFLNNPELVMTLENSTKILFDGMLDGWFTTRKLSQYFNNNISDPVNARRIINSLDCAYLISEIYRKFLKSLAQ